MADDLVQPSMLSHARGSVTYMFALVVAATLLALTPRVGSRAVSAGGGLAAGGALATVVCGLAWRGGVPNPLVHGDVAFNVADLSIGVGVALLIGGALVHAWTNRRRLFEPL